MYSVLANTFDALLELKDAGAVTSTNTAGTVGGSARVVDLGDAFAKGSLHVNVTAIDLASNDEGYDIIVQGCDASGFGSNVANLVTLKLGKSSVSGNPADSTTGLISVPFLNSLDGKNTYRYVRIMTKVVGTTPSINFKAWLTKNPM